MVRQWIEYYQPMGNNYIPTSRNIIRVMMGYYDVVLGLIPVSFLGITGVLYAGGLGLASSVFPAALVTAALVGHALFVRAPVNDTDGVEERPTFQPAD